jgi:XTP/dITP diphosphohydrolase
MEKVLSELHGNSNRKARFKTVIALKIDSNEFLFEGIVYGTISEEKKGEKGFGYDPIFIPDGYDRTYAEMSLEEKNIMSHRALAVEKLKIFLKKPAKGPI